MPAISSSYARLTAVHPALCVTNAAPRSDGGWTAVSDLAAGGRTVADFVAREAERLTARYGRRPRPDVAATLALHRYLWPACLLFTVPWFLRHRVPRLPPGAVSVHRASGAMTVRPEGFGCLPGDRAARLPGARTVPSRAALREELRSALAAHLAPVLKGFGPLLRRGPHALWGMATDEVAEGLWYVAGLMGESEESRARAELAALLPGGTPPFVGAAGFPVPQRGAGPARRTRLTCCLVYTLDPGAACAGCPRALGRTGIRSPAYATARTTLRSRSSQPLWHGSSTPGPVRDP